MKFYLLKKKKKEIIKKLKKPSKSINQLSTRKFEIQGDLRNSFAN